MIPLADNAVLVIRIDENGLVGDVSTNIAPAVSVLVVHSKAQYEAHSQVYPLEVNKARPNRLTPGK